jgi:hypothetical protein
MNRPIALTLSVGLLALAATVPQGDAQEASRPGGAVAPPSKTRPLAPGVLTVIPTDGQAAETFTGPRPIVEITQGIPNLEWTPNYEPKSATLLERSKDVIFRRPIWNLEFAFKPLRMIEVDVPHPSGRMQRKMIWYMVYRVKNVGYDLNPVPVEEQLGEKAYKVERVNYPTLRFFPHFVLASHEFKKEYLDRIIPAAKPVIQARENPGVPLLNSVEISQVTIPLSEERFDRSVWGFVTWEDIDPRIDFFSVYIRGLTNAFQYVDPEGAFKPGDPPGTGRVFSFKTLQLTFWRPGDTEDMHEKELRYGVPVESDPEKQQAILDKYGLPHRLDYRWIYRYGQAVAGQDAEARKVVLSKEAN